MSKLKDEQPMDMRSALNCLIVDETEAVDGYDRVLVLEGLTDEHRVILERIRNAEIDHIKDLSLILQQYSTAAVVGKDSAVKDSKWCMHQAPSGYFYFRDSEGRPYCEQGRVLRFGSKVPAGEFYVKNLYNKDAWGGEVPKVVVDGTTAVLDYSARGSFNSLGELKTHYANSSLLLEGDQLTVILKSGKELIYKYIDGGKLVFIRGTN